MQPLNKCPVCSGSSLNHEGLHYDRRKCLEGKWVFNSCSSCNSYFLNPMPEEADLIYFYSNYYQDSADVLSNLKKRSWISRNLRKCYHIISGDVDPRDLVKVNSDDVVLDYGCGPGVYMHEFMHKSNNVYGADLSEDAVRAGADCGLEIRLIEGIEKIPFEDNKFSHIYAFQVLEHLTNPHSFMEELARVSKQGAEICLAFPNIDSIWRKIFKRNWVSGWFSPFHAVLYNEKSVSLLADSHGFIVKGISSRTPISWFMLNLRASILRFGSVERSRCIFDSVLFKVPIMIVLRLVEIFPVQRDCLVVKLVKK